MVQLPGVDVNAANAQGWTALHVAASLGHEGKQQQQQHIDM
jgi:ankyrin repeat protein